MEKERRNYKEKKMLKAGVDLERTFTVKNRASSSESDGRGEVTVM